MSALQDQTWRLVRDFIAFALKEQGAKYTPPPMVGTCRAYFTPEFGKAVHQLTIHQRLLYRSFVMRLSRYWALNEVWFEFLFLSFARTLFDEDLSDFDFEKLMCLFAFVGECAIGFVVMNLEGGVQWTISIMSKFIVRKLLTEIRRRGSYRQFAAYLQEKVKRHRYRVKQAEEVKGQQKDLEQIRALQEHMMNLLLCPDAATAPAESDDKKTIMLSYLENETIRILLSFSRETLMILRDTFVQEHRLKGFEITLEEDISDPQECENRQSRAVEAAGFKIMPPIYVLTEQQAADWNDYEEWTAHMNTDLLAQARKLYSLSWRYTTTYLLALKQACEGDVSLGAFVVPPVPGVTPESYVRRPQAPHDARVAPSEGRSAARQQEAAACAAAEPPGVFKQPKLELLQKGVVRRISEVQRRKQETQSGKPPNTEDIPGEVKGVPQQEATACEASVVFKQPKSEPLQKRIGKRTSEAQRRKPEPQSGVQQSTEPTESLQKALGKLISEVQRPKMEPQSKEKSSTEHFCVYDVVEHNHPAFREDRPDTTESGEDLPGVGESADLDDASIEETGDGSTQQPETKKDEKKRRSRHKRKSKR